MPYQFTSRIRYSEIDESRHLTLPGLVNYFQDCSTFQSETIGNGVDAMLAAGKAWILAYWQIEITRLPVLTEAVTIQTWASGFRGFQGKRNYRMLDEAGETLACAHSLWIYLDIHTGHPCRLDPEVIELYPVEPALELEQTSRKVLLPEGCTEQEPFAVCRHHLDTNHHVNNVQYISMAQDYLGEKREVSRIRVEYKRQALLGEQIVPLVHEEDGITTVGLCGEDRQPYAVIEFTQRQEQTC